MEAFEHASAGGRGSRTSWLCPCACADCKDRQSFPGPSCRRSRIRPLPSRPTAGSGSSLVERCYEVETPFPRSPGGGAGIRLVGLLDVHAAGWRRWSWWWRPRWRWWLWRPPRWRPALSGPRTQRSPVSMRCHRVGQQFENPEWAHFDGLVGGLRIRRYPRLVGV